MSENRSGRRPTACVATFLSDEWAVAARDGSGSRFPCGPVRLTIDGVVCQGHGQWLELAGGGVDAQFGLISLTGTTSGGGERDFSCPEEVVTLAGENIIDLGSFLRQYLAPLSDADRNLATAFLAGATKPVDGATAPASLSRQLHRCRQALRERLPPSIIQKRSSPAIAIDKIAEVSPTCFYIRGWMFHSSGGVPELVAVSPEGHRVAVPAGFPRHRRPDLAALYPESAVSDCHGFAAVACLPTPSLADEGWLLELRSADGCQMEAAAPTVTRPASVIDDLLNEQAIDDYSRDDLRSKVLRPAVARAQDRPRARIAREVQHRSLSHEPTVSLVVPVHMRIDGLEHQLVHFANDRQMRDADILYVLQAPEFEHEFLRAARRLAALYPTPFRVVVLDRSCGRAAAVNVGVAIARGRKTLIMSSDVLPESPGWLHRLCAAYDQLECVGALAPKLLHEDESVQHAGTEVDFAPDEFAATFVPRLKGLHRESTMAQRSAEVAAVSDACMLVDTELYKEVGGFSEAYVCSTLAHIDFCQRLRARGRRNWYEASVEMYNLEGLSYSPEVGAWAEEYNEWLYTETWRPSLSNDV